MLSTPPRTPFPKPTTTNPSPSPRTPPTEPAPFKPKRIHFLTLADDDRPEVCLVGSILYQSGHILQILAWNHSTRFFDNTTCGVQCGANEGNDFRVGQQKKTHWLHHYIMHTNHLDDDDVILFTDSYDVIIQADVNELPNLFLKQTKDRRGIIFNSEPTCGDSFTLGGDYGDHLRNAVFGVQLYTNTPVKSVLGWHMCEQIEAKSIASSVGDGPNKFLGSGGFIGDVKTVREFLQRVKMVHKKQQDAFESGASPFFFYGDQISFQLAYVLYPELNAQVDRNGEIFFVVSSGVHFGIFENFLPNFGCTDNYFSNGIGSNLTWSHSKPIFFHFPGGYKHLYTTCAKHVLKRIIPISGDQFMFDIDRQRSISMESVCPNMT
ncbi:hypothetical protein THRCLA_07820 [Thraustotheca clavata]|uniref:PLOD1-3-like GT domain-containing protein n=1 Tax=Thraustotheca clavata TaxID=74557 RepID=A0A1V9ZBX2_9STRA|nr:hypothetical protein THRCLA_07820 [Thraustotheca clavata]